MVALECFGRKWNFRWVTRSSFLKYPILLIKSCYSYTSACCISSTIQTIITATTAPLHQYLLDFDVFYALPRSPPSSTSPSTMPLTKNSLDAKFAMRPSTSVSLFLLFTLRFSCSKNMTHAPSLNHRIPVGQAHDKPPLNTSHVHLLHHHSHDKFHRKM